MQSKNFHDDDDDDKLSSEAIGQDQSPSEYKLQP